MLEGIVLGTIQGITEWLPISSEGFIVLAQVHLFGQSNVRDMIFVALFLHLGTFFAALLYFRVEVWALIKTLFRYRRASPARQATLRFLVISTAVSGLIGFGLLQTLVRLESYVLIPAKALTGAIGLLLLITAWLQLSAKSSSLRSPEDASYIDGILLGLVQGLAVLPGLSRSGLTVSLLLLRKFNDTHALTLSFLMSLPVVLGANIVLNLNHFTITLSNLLGCLLAFGFGLGTIHGLIALSRKLNFGYFVLVIGLLMAASVVL